MDHGAIVGERPTREKPHAKAQSRQGSQTSELCAFAPLREVIPVSEDSDERCLNMLRSPPRGSFWMSMLQSSTFRESGQDQ
jgi:hypothetical protein